MLARRTRISIEYAHRGVDCAQQVAKLIAPVLGWDDAEVDREVATYLARVDAEVRSQAQPDDESADALRAAAPEAREQILEPVPIGMGRASLRLDALALAWALPAQQGGIESMGAQPQAPVRRPRNRRLRS